MYQQCCNGASRHSNASHESGLTVSKLLFMFQDDRKEAGRLLSICQTPFILTPAAKSHILQGEAFLQKQSHMQASGLQVRPFPTSACARLSPVSEVPCFQHVFATRVHPSAATCSMVLLTCPPQVDWAVIMTGLLHKKQLLFFHAPQMSRSHPNGIHWNCSNAGVLPGDSSHDGLVP